MSKRPDELSRELAEVRAEMKKIDQAANGGALEGETEKRWNDLSTRADALNSAFARATKLSNMERNEPVRDTRDVSDAKQKFGLDVALRGQLRRMGRPVPGFENEDDGREVELSQEMARRSGITEGFAVPVSSFRRSPEQRAVSWGAGSGSGAGLQAEQYRPDQIVTELQAVSMAGSLGVPFLTELIGASVTLPKIDTGLQLQFVAEGSALTPADPTTSKLTLVPRIAGAVTSISPTLLLQPQAQSIISDHLLRVGAAGLDRVIFAGGGANEPSGLWDTLTPATLGGPTWAEILGLIEAVELDNVSAARLAWAMNPSAKRVLRSTPKVVYEGSPYPDQAFDSFIMENANTLADYPAISSTTIPTTGSPPSAAGLVVGDMTQVCAGVFEAASLLINPFSSADFLRGQLGLRLLLQCDVVVKNESAFRSATINI